MCKTKRKVEDRMTQADMTPMIDCIFQLIIFFMCSIHFKEIEGKLMSWMPQHGEGDGVPDILPNEITVSITYDQSLRRTGYAVMNKKVNNLDELITEVKWGINQTNLTEGKEPMVKISPARNVPFQPVIDVLNQCKAAKIDRIEFAALR